MTTDEMKIRFPTFYSGAKLVKDWGWLFLIIWLALGFRLQTPAAFSDQLSAQMASVRLAIQQVADSVHAIQYEQKAMARLIQWNTGVACRSLTAEEVRISPPCLR